MTLAQRRRVRRRLCWYRQLTRSCYRNLTRFVEALLVRCIVGSIGSKIEYAWAAELIGNEVGVASHLHFHTEFSPASSCRAKDIIIYPAIKQPSLTSVMDVNDILDGNINRHWHHNRWAKDAVSSQRGNSIRILEPARYRVSVEQGKVSAACNRLGYRVRPELINIKISL